MSEAEKTFSKKGRDSASLTPKECTALAQWYAADFPENNGMPEEFRAAAAKINCEKWAATYGTKLVAMLADRGFLEPGQNPTKALLDLFLDLEEAQSDF